MTRKRRTFAHAPGWFFIILGMIFMLMNGQFSVQAADSPVPAILTLEAEDGQHGGPASRSGRKVGNLGKCGGTSEGTITFESLELPADGWYTLRFHYYSGSDDRYFHLTANGETCKLPCPSTGGFDRVGTIETDIFLTAGGTLVIGSDWYAPDLDKVEIFEPAGSKTAARTYENRAEQVFTSGELRLVCDTNNGIWSLYSGGIVVIRDAHAEFDHGGRSVSSDDFTVHEAVQTENTVTFTHTGHPSFDGTMTQAFELGDILLTDVRITGENVSTNRIAPLAVYEGGLGERQNGVFVQIPFDNDMWVEPSVTSVRKLGQSTVSYEAAALFEEETGTGLVIGSIEHDVWKTGICLDVLHGMIRGCTAFGGISDSGTRDNSPHGSVSGMDVRSPKLFIGYFADWRDGMTAYAKANASVVPPKESVKDVPFGYNSWGVLQSKVGYSDMIAVSDYIKEHLQDTWTSDDAPVYVNIDSFWDFIVHNDPSTTLSLEDALKTFVEHCHANGQKAGIYYTPFTAWHGDEATLKSSKMEGSDYTYYDAAVKKSDGSGLYGKLDGGYALDPTHPGTIARMEYKLNWFIDLGFEYVKLDFMTHGAVEGQHYDPSVTTGMQAYNAGMAKIAAICDGKLYVNLSIAPLFPYQYADGRRISCDAFSSIDNTKHVLSYLTACFWEDELYPYPDPDHLVVWGKDGDVSEGEARCRVTSGVISGTSFLVGDDLSDVTDNAQKQERITKLFGNADIVSTAKLGRMFRPYEVHADSRCADAYWFEEDGVLYLAVFNFAKNETEIRCDLSGQLPSGTVFNAVELWNGNEVPMDGTVLMHTLPAEDAAVFRIIPMADGEETLSVEPAEEPRDSKMDLLSLLVAGAASLGILAAAAVVYGRRKNDKNETDKPKQ